MKKLAWIIVILLLVVIAFFQFRNFQRFHPGTDYDYPINTEIDAHYHDPQAVMEYYQTAYQAGNFARSIWSSERIDVKFPDAGDLEEESAARTYEQMLATAAFLEAKLVASANLKKQGFSNSDIRYIEESGIAPDQLNLRRQLGESTLKKGDEGPAVHLLQERLLLQGFELPVDGKFLEQTEAAILAFQQKQGLIPTGVADPYTLEKLLTQNNNPE